MTHVVAMSLAGDELHNLFHLIWKGLHKPTRWLVFPWLLGVYLLLRFLPPNEKLAPHKETALRFLAGASLLVWAAALVFDFSYLLTAYISDPYANVYACTSWLVGSAEPIYHDFQTSFRYSTPYGPDGMLIEGAFEHLLGGSIFSAKVVPFLAALGSPCLMYVVLRRQVASAVALPLVVLLVSLQIFYEGAFQPRADDLILLCVSLAFLTRVERHPWHWLILGMLFGIIVELKIHGFLYLLPLLALGLTRSRPPLLLAGAALMALVVAALPFVVVPNISFSHFRLLLSINAGHPSVAGFWIQLARLMAGFLLLGFFPLILFRVSWAEALVLIKKYRLFITVLLLSQMIACYPASLIGAGPHHLLPLVPSWLFLATSLYADLGHLERKFTVSRWGTALLVSVLFFVFAVGVKEAVSGFRRIWAQEPLVRADLADLNQILKSNPGTTVMLAISADGKSRNCAPAFVLVTRGMPLGITPSGMMDSQENRRPEPRFDDLEQEIEQRYSRPVIWLVRRGATPFQELSSYTSRPVFSDQFGRDFLRSFSLREQTNSFDIYRKSSP